MDWKMQLGFSIIPNVVAGMVLAMLVGAAFTSLTFWFFRQRRATSRLIDLVSFSIAGVGLIASIFAVGSYEKRINQAARIAELGKAAIIAVERIRSIAKEHCPLGDGADSRDPKTFECMRFHEYSSSLGNLDFARGALLPSPPSLPRPNGLEALKTSFEIENVVFNYNLRANVFLFDEQARLVDPAIINEITTIIYSAYAVSFAFGMGWVRRVYDAWNA